MANTHEAISIGYDGKFESPTDLLRICQTLVTWAQMGFGEHAGKVLLAAAYVMELLLHDGDHDDVAACIAEGQEYLRKTVNMIPETGSWAHPTSGERPQ